MNNLQVKKVVGRYPASSWCWGAESDVPDNKSWESKPSGTLRFARPTLAYHFYHKSERHCL
jgi:hypothetical protein